MSINKNTMISNVVPYDALRTVQLFTLAHLRDSIIHSFGPKGSNSLILKENMFPKYTKDGHEILDSIHFNNGIEQSVKENMRNLTAKIVKDVGDGTTSAVILSSIIFENLCFTETEHKMKPFEVGQSMTAVSKKIAKEIMKHKKECTIDDIRDICMISSNSNVELTESIVGIYKEYGMDVFIDVLASMGTESFVKVMDGMTLPSGMMDTCFINTGNGATAKSYIRNPYIYLFEDPVDTPEMLVFFDSIIRNNIISPLVNKSNRFIPTVILVPKLSKDTSAYLDKIVETMNNVPLADKPPLLIVNEIYDSERYTDISLMCGCKPIKKYIDPELQKKDIESGVAPTPETVFNFYGRAEAVESTDEYTKFVNPSNMITEEGEKTDEYKNLLYSLESKLKRAEIDGSDMREIGSLKRRINSLKANLVEYYVGGISMTDREALRASAEDAVKNCRSAATYGVGCGANFEGLRASLAVLAELEEELTKDMEHESFLKYRKEKYLAKVISDAYAILLSILYLSSIESTGTEEEKTSIVDSMIKTSLEKGMPINLNTFKYDGKVLSSIQSDIVILDTVSTIISLMYTCNQAIMPTAYHNVYTEPKRYDGKPLHEDIATAKQPVKNVADAISRIEMPPELQGLTDNVGAFESEDENVK